MKIAYILNSTVANGGATKAFLNILDGLSQYDIKPYVVVPDRDGVFLELSKRQIPTLVQTYRPSVYPYSHTLKQRMLFLPKLAARIIVNHKATRALSKWIRENGIDIVHSNTGVVRIGFDAARKTGIPHIYHIREFANMLGYHYFPMQASFAHQLKYNCSYSICITKAVQHHYYQDNKTKRSRVIYDGVFSQMTDLPSSVTKSYFLFAGRIQPPKGLDQLLNAYKIYADQSPAPIPLKVAGSNGDDAYYQKQLKYIKDNHLTEHVELLGNRDDIAALMREARALIVSSLFEGFGFCLPEAMQQGCLVIGRNTSGTKEQMDNALEMTGKEIALRYETAEELAKLLSEVASNPPEFYRPYLERAFKTVNKLYTVENNTRQIYQFYKDILNGTNT